MFMDAIENRAFTWIGYGVIVAVVFLAMFYGMNKMQDNTGFKQEVYAKNFALTENILLVNNYDYNVKINVEPEFEFIFEGCNILVNERDTPGSSGDSYYCSENFKVSKENSLDGEYNSIILKIKEGGLEIGGV